MDIFDFMYEPLRFDKNKPIKLFEAFSGIGTQSLALKYLGIKVEHIGISEVDHHAIKSYRAIHGDVKNYGGIGSFDKLPAGVDIATWSFPCQDISLAGKQKGMEDGTQSNYGYVFLDTIKNMDYKDRPKVLLMENVKALLSEKFRDDWRNIQLRLENMGYKNYADSLIATDYGVPQTRDRVFIVSVKGEYNYNFPKPIPLVKKLKDYLEDKVDEKYYLSDKKIEQIVNWKAYNKPLENAKSVDDDVIQTITAKSNTSMNSSMVLIKEATKQGYSIAEDGDGIYINRPHQKRGVVQKDKIQTIKTSVNDIGVVVKETENYLESNVLGSIDNSRRAWKTDKVIGTITTNSETSKILEKDTRNLKEKLADNLIESGIVKGGEVINHSYTNKSKNPNSRLTLEDYIETNNGIMPTLTTRVDTLGVVVKDTKNYIEHESLGSFNSERRAYKEDKVIGTITTKSDKSKVLLNDLRIRKLTPLEAWRLMGIKDEDFHKAKSSGMSDSQLYKQAGNAIVVDVLMAIFSQMIK